MTSSKNMTEIPAFSSPLVKDLLNDSLLVFKLSSLPQSSDCPVKIKSYC